jgi:hypothetical protein
MTLIDLSHRSKSGEDGLHLHHTHWLTKKCDDKKQEHSNYGLFVTYVEYKNKHTLIRGARIKQQ